MTVLSELEGKIAALKKRHAELDEKLVPLRNGIIDVSVSNAMSSIAKEINRLECLRQDALVGDLIEKEPAAEPAISTPRAAPTALPLPRDFPSSEVPDTDPLDELERLPSGDDFVQLQQNLAAFCTEQVGQFIRDVRGVFKDTHPVSYTQSQHLGVQAALGFVLAQTRLLVATGRDRRNHLEEKLAKRIEALESRIAEITRTDLDHLKSQARSDHALIENAIRRLGLIEETPRISYKGVWLADAQYNAGDLVTSDGSAFFCHKATRGVKPGTSSDFQLMVKRGRDGRDAKGA